MKIVIGYPPNIEDIRKRFDVEGKNILITIGDILYNPLNAPISEELMIHEQRHSTQHLAYPGGPSAFIERFYKDREFRKQAEAEAYGDQYAFLCESVSDGYRQAKMLDHLVKQFMSPIYDLGITYKEAAELIIENSL